MTNQTATVLMDIEQALEAMENSLPVLLPIVGTFYPPLKALVPFLPLLQIALTAVKQAEEALNVTTPAAVQHVTTVIQTAPSTPITPAN